MAPLEDDCKLLRNLLDDCLRIEVGENLFNKVRHGLDALMGLKEAHEA